MGSLASELKIGTLNPRTLQTAFTDQQANNAPESDDDDEIKVSPYNCGQNCIECEVWPPNHCTKCLPNYFVDQNTRECARCKVAKCNLCSSANICKQCRIGHVPEGQKCKATIFFIIFAYLSLILTILCGLCFFVLCICVGVRGEDVAKLPQEDSFHEKDGHESCSGHRKSDAYDQDYEDDDYDEMLKNRKRRISEGLNRSLNMSFKEDEDDSGDEIRGDVL